MSIQANNYKLGDIVHDISPNTKQRRNKPKSTDDYKNRDRQDEERKGTIEHILLYT